MLRCALQARFRTLNFNLRDPKNPHFIKAVVLGQVHVNDKVVRQLQLTVPWENVLHLQSRASHRLRNLAR